MRAKILSWHGCELELEGACQYEEVKTFNTAGASAAAQVVNLNSKLSDLRLSAGREGREGPRVMVIGDDKSGKTTLVRTLASYATRQGYQPLVVNTDPREGMLSLPGTLSASVFATIMDPESVDGWGSTPTSGPSLVPVKLPLVTYFGHERPHEDEDFYRTAVGRLAESTSGRLSEDGEVKRSGLLVDSFGIKADDKAGLELIAHVVDELSGKLSRGKGFA